MTERKMVYMDDAAIGFEGEDGYYWAKALMQEKLKSLSAEERSKVSGCVSLAGSLLGCHTSGRLIDPDIVNAISYRRRACAQKYSYQNRAPRWNSRVYYRSRVTACGN